MTINQLQETSEYYYSLFGSPMCQRTLQLLSTVTTLAGLETIEHKLSNGEYDAAEAILSGR